MRQELIDQLKQLAVHLNKIKFDPKLMLADLLLKDCISQEEEEFIMKRESQTGRVVELCIKFLPAKNDDIFYKILTILKDHGVGLPAEILHSNSIVHAQSITIPKVSEAYELAVIELQNLYKTQCEIMQQQWSHFLDYADEFKFSEGFIELEIIDVGKRTDNPTFARTYEEVFDCPQEVFDCPHGIRIVLEGEAGMGKTTYLHKIALDWAEDKDQWLSSRFQLVLLAKLGEISPKEGMKEVFLSQLTATAQTVLLQHLTNDPEIRQRTLIILDAFDEFFYRKECPDIENLIIGEKHKYGLVTVLVSTRTLCTREIQPRHRLLKSSGFSEEHMKLLATTNTGLNEVLRSRYLKDLLRNPLVFGMFKAVCQEEEIKELFQLMQVFCNHLAERHQKLKKQALNMTAEFDRYIAEVAYGFHSRQEKISVNKDMLLIAKNIGLLWNSRKSNDLVSISSNNEFLIPSEWKFPHQVFQEYYAAKYCTSMNINMYVRDPFRTFWCTEVFNYFCIGFSESFRQECFDKDWLPCFSSCDNFNYAIIPPIALPETVNVKKAVKKIEKLQTVLWDHWPSVLAKHSTTILLKRIANDILQKKVVLNQLELTNIDYPVMLHFLTEKLIIRRLNGSDDDVEKFMRHFSKILWKNSVVKGIVIKDLRVVCHSDFDKTCKSMSKLKRVTVMVSFGKQLFGLESISFSPFHNGTSSIQQCLQNIVDKKVTEFVSFIHGNAILESRAVSFQDFVCQRQDFWHCCATLPNLKTVCVNGVPIGSSSCKRDLLKVISQCRIEKLYLEDISMDEEFVSSFIQTMQGHSSIEVLYVSYNEILNTRPDVWDCLLTFKSLKVLTARKIVIPSKQKEAMKLKNIDVSNLKEVLNIRCVIL